MCVYSHSMGLFELADLLNLIHEISTVYVLHDKIQTVLQRDRRADMRKKSQKVHVRESRREVRERSDDSETLSVSYC